MAADFGNSICGTGERTTGHGKSTKINISTTTTVVNAVCLCVSVTCSSKGAACDLCNIVILNNGLIIVAERTAIVVNLARSSFLIVFRPAAERTAINRQDRLVKPLISVVVVGVKVSIRNKAGEFTTSGIVPSSLHGRAIIDCHGANVLDGVPRVLATLTFVHAVFLRTIKGTAIYDNSSLIVQRTFSVRNIINPTRSRDGQVTIVQNGVTFTLVKVLLFRSSVWSCPRES